MKCFNHKEKDAVAICKNCGKGLCEECATESNNAISCKGKCEEKIKKAEELIEYSEDIKEIIKKGKKITLNANKNTAQSYYISSIICFLFGGLFILVDFGEEFPEELNLFFLGGGLLMIVAAVLRWIQGNKYKKQI